MKRFIIAILSLAFCGEIQAEKKDTVRFVYVLQNPKFYGIDKATSWFELEGMDDKTVQNKINETLRNAYFERTELDTNYQGATLRTENKTPNGYSDYSFYNGQTYGYGWIRFKDSDSLLRLKDADGYYGSGTNLGGFYSQIAEGKLGWIQISPSGYNEKLSRGNPITLAFHLGTGNVIKDTYLVHLDASKRDSLEKLLDAKAVSNANSGIYHGSKIISRERLSDSVQISLSVYIQWLNGKPSPYANTVCRSFDMFSIMEDGREVTWNPNACLTLTEAIPFMNQDEWLALPTICQ